MDIIAEFTDNNGFTVQLTTEKIFVTSVGAEETFALRSVSGVGLYDDINKFNRELAEFKKSSDPTVPYIVAGLFGALGVWGLVDGESTAAVEGIGGAIGGFLLGQNNKGKTPPKLDSFFTLMLSGGDRRFKFYKTDSNAKDIAKFINNVEDTLTAYSQK